MPLSNGSLEDEDCSVITDWTDGDKGVGNSYQVGNYFCFLTNASAANNDYAKRSKDSGSIEGLGNRVFISLSLQLTTIGTHANTDYFELLAYRSDWFLSARFASDGLFIRGATGYSEVGTNLVQTGVWQEWTFDIDFSAGLANANCDVYLNNVLKASGVSCNISAAGTDGESRFYLYGYSTDDLVGYLDWYKVGDGSIWKGKLNGITNPGKIMGISVANILKVMGA